MKITKQSVDGIKPNGTDFYLFDEKLTGFGVRVRASGGMSYIVKYRAGAGRNAPVRRWTIGMVGKVEPETARKEARRILAEVTQGGDPAAEKSKERKEMSVAELAELFLAEHVVAKRRATTADSYARVVKNHIAPAFGSTRIDKLTPTMVSKLHVKMKDKPAMANRVLAVIGSMFGFAAKRKLVADGFNPAKGVDKYEEARRERLLSAAELERLGAAIARAETIGIDWSIDEENPNAKHAPKSNQRTIIGPYAAAALRLYLFTGCRLREILNLKWADVDFERGMLHLPRTKTTRRSVILNAPALEVLASLPRIGDCVIAGNDPDRPRTDLKRPWKAIVRHAGLDDLRIHDLRHNFGSHGAGSGLGLPIIGKLLGHKNAATTQRYAHLDADPVRRVSNTIGAKIDAALKGRPDVANIVQIGARRVL